MSQNWSAKPYLELQKEPLNFGLLDFLVNLLIIYIPIIFQYEQQIIINSIKKVLNCHHN